MKLNTVMIRIITKLNLNIYIENTIQPQWTFTLLYVDNCYMFNQDMQVT